jgi:predicted aconitase
MTPKQAQTKANQLWGKGKEYLSAGGHINKRRPYQKMESSIPQTEWRFDVGYVSTIVIPMFHVKGTGESWEAAFRDAERKAELDKQRMDEARARVAAKKAAAVTV